MDDCFLKVVAIPALDTPGLPSEISKVPEVNTIASSLNFHNKERDKSEQNKGQNQAK